MSVGAAREGRGRTPRRAAAERNNGVTDAAEVRLTAEPARRRHTFL